MSNKVLILDTNALLGMNNYPKEIYNEIIKGFNNISEYDIFIPRRVCFEFFKKVNKITGRNPVDQKLI